MDNYLKIIHVSLSFSGALLLLKRAVLCRGANRKSQKLFPFVNMAKKLTGFTKGPFGNFLSWQLYGL